MYSGSNHFFTPTKRQRVILFDILHTPVVGTVPVNLIWCVYMFYYSQMKYDYMLVFPLLVLINIIYIPRKQFFLQT